ncbi:MAG: class I SAM-dependent methyltransferase [Alphaproteobacteria bacterium]|nr:class I SAM-dependent methyltransferase [Alphaproteobacteria bacterium]
MCFGLRLLFPGRNRLTISLIPPPPSATRAPGPTIHPLLIDRLRPRVAAERSLKRAADVGCGAGQSTVALTAIADDVVGLDDSAAMLANAEPHPRVRYLQALAEALPLQGGAIDLISAGSAFHWFDRILFLREAARALKPGGWLAIYNDGFSGQMIGNPAYGEWNKTQYVARFPTPPRDQRPLADEQAAAAELVAATKDAFVHEVPFTAPGLLDYLTTQTNVLAAVAAGRDRIEEATDWLRNAVAPLFSAPTESFLFRCSYGLYRRT